MKTLTLLPALLLAASAFGQSKDAASATEIPVRVQTIANFRGVAANQLQGYGLVVGLAATGDTKKVIQTQKAILNLLRANGLEVDPTQSETKNVALVALTATLPPYARPGARLDVTVAAMGDCTSLRGGQLLFSTLGYPGLPKTIVTVSGAVSVGGVSASAGGNTSSKGFTTVGALPGAGIVQEGIDTQAMTDGKLFLDLSDADPIQSRRIEQAIRAKYPQYNPQALGPGSVQIEVPKGTSENTVQANVSDLSVVSTAEAKVVIDERTGTIVIGGDVRIGPCMVAQGSVSVKVTSTPFVSQPKPLSQGQTVAGTVKTADVSEPTAEITAIRSNTSLADLAAIFQAMHLKATDVINILRSMHDQGALKARLEIR